MKEFRFIITFKNGEKLKLFILAENYLHACIQLFDYKYIIFENLWGFECAETKRKEK